MQRCVMEVSRVLGVLLFLIVVGEGGLHFCPPWLLPEDVQQWLTDRLSVGHPALGAVERPQATGVFVGRDFQVPYRTDSQGFHNTWPWTDRVDVLALGDGMTLGYGVEASQAWPALVAQAIDPNQLLNLAMIDAGPLQYARAYELFGTARHPKVVLVGLSLTDDFQDALFFERWQHAGLGENYRVWRASGGVPGSWWNPLSAMHALLARHSILYQMVRVSLLVERTSSKFIWFPGGQYIQMWPKRLDTILSQAQPGQHAFTLVFEALAYLQVIARAYETQVIVVCLPSKEEIYLPASGASPVDPGRPLREALQQRGMVTLDLAPPLRQEGAKGQVLFYPASRYFNAQGQALIAHHVLQHLAAQSYALRPWGARRHEAPEARFRVP